MRNTNSPYFGPNGHPSRDDLANQIVSPEKPKTELQQLRDQVQRLQEFCELLARKLKLFS